MGIGAPARRLRGPADGLASRLAADRRSLEARLAALLHAETGTPPRLRAAMAHSLLGGGKRLRPLLLLWSYDACAEGRRRAAALTRRGALDAACAVEMIHTYSLIHDDLPAMDDDDLRRGRPTCHVAFGEATAILAGDGLQALAFAVLARLGAGAAAAAAEIAGAAGPGGLVGGQQEDLLAPSRRLTPALILGIHRRKTAALIAAALAAGAALAGGPPRRVAAVRAAGLRLGLAFQAADDLLDVEGTPGRVGKGTGKDAAAGKATWVRLEGAAAARCRAKRLGERGQRELAAALPAGGAARRLVALAGRLWDRET